MNLDLILEIAELVDALVANATHPTANATPAATTLLQILQKGAQAYEQQTGAALDPSLLHVEATV